MNWRPHWLPSLRPERLAIAALVAVATLFLVALGWLQVTRVARHKVDQTVAKVGRKLGLPIAIGKWAITPTGAHFEDVRIGEGANIVISRMTAEVGLNPFGAGFGELDSVTIHQVRVKTGLAGVRGSVEGLKAAGLLEGEGAAGKAQRSIERLFAALPTQRLLLESGGVTVVDDEGRALLTVRGLKVLVEKKTSRVLFHIASVRGAGGLSDEALSGRFELSQKANDYRFFVRRTGPAKANAWAVSGTVQRDLSAVSLTSELRRLPSFLADAAEGYIGKDPTLNLRSRVEATRDGEAWRFTARVQSLGTTVLVPLASVRPIGPVHFDLNAKGFWRPDDRVLGVEAATLSVPSRVSGRYGRAPVRFAANGAGRLPGEGDSGFAVQGHVALESAPCQALLDAAPAGLLAALTDFKLEGSAAAELDFDLDTQRPEDVSFAMHDAQFGCKVLGAPYTYSAEHLAGPFVLTREVGKDDAPRELNVSPLSADFTPLEQIAKTVDVAFVTSEDASFFTHRGIDGAALSSAVRRDLAEKRVAVGGSTITMQTVKNLFLTQERTFSRKLQELFLAWHLENVLKKERILEIYMNIVEFGPGIYGITQASEHFFAKHPDSLTLLESAYLASLLPSPKARYRYFCEGKVTPNFRELVNGLLRRMVSMGRIPYDRYLGALSASLQFNDETRLAARECSTRPVEDEEDGHEP